MNVTVTTSPKSVKVFVSGVLHLKIKRADLFGIQSWIDWKGDFYVIDFTTRHGSVTAEYDSRILWTKILRQLDKKDLFD